MLCPRSQETLATVRVNDTIQSPWPGLPRARLECAAGSVPVLSRTLQKSKTPGMTKNRPAGKFSGGFPARLAGDLRSSAM